MIITISTSEQKSIEGFQGGAKGSPAKAAE